MKQTIIPCLLILALFASYTLGQAARKPVKNCCCEHVQLLCEEMPKIHATLINQTTVLRNINQSIIHNKIRQQDAKISKNDLDAKIEQVTQAGAEAMEKHLKHTYIKIVEGMTKDINRAYPNNEGVPAPAPEELDDPGDVTVPNFGSGHVDDLPDLRRKTNSTKKPN